MSDIYIPSITSSLKEKKFPQIRLGLQGEPASGKTTSALTFPNCHVLNFDNGLTAYAGREDIIEAPFWNNEWVSSINNGAFAVKKLNATIPNKKDCLIWYMKEHCLKMTSNQTLILDSWTTIQNAFDLEQELHPKISKLGSVDEFDFWAKKMEYSSKLMELICSMKCHVVVTFHESKTRDIKTGQLLEKIQPLMQGKFTSQLKIFFTDFFRMKAEEKKDMQSQKEIGCSYFWQIKSDGAFDAKTRLTTDDKVFQVEPHFKIFEQYRKTI